MTIFAVTFYRDMPASMRERIHGMPGHWPALVTPWAPSVNETEILPPRVGMTKEQIEAYMQQYMPDYINWELSLPASYFTGDM